MSGEMTRERLHNMLTELEDADIRAILKTLQATLPHTDDMARSYIAKIRRRSQTFQDKRQSGISVSTNDLTLDDDVIREFTVITQESASRPLGMRAQRSSDHAVSAEPLSFQRAQTSAPGSGSTIAFPRSTTTTTAVNPNFRRRSKTEAVPLPIKHGAHVLKSKRFIKDLCDKCNKPMTGLLKQGYECMRCSKVYHSKCLDSCPQCVAAKSQSLDDDDDE